MEPERGATVQTAAAASSRRDLLFALAAWVLLTSAGVVGGILNGSLGQLPHWDSAFFYEHAREFSKCVKAADAAGFYDVWVHFSEGHTPLVPAVSSFFMAAFGDTLAVAWLALPLFGILFCVSLVKIVRILYPSSTATVYGATLLTISFPVVLNYSRLYLYEFPMAALALATFWGMLASDRFTRWRPCVAAGAAAGLTALARGGAPATLLGVSAVLAGTALAKPPRGVKLKNMVLAGAAAAVIAATWYLPNLSTFLAYVNRVTYGDDATVFTGGSSALTWESAEHYLLYYVVEGPGVPLAALAALAWLVNCIVRRRVVVSRTMLGLTAAFALTVLALLPAAQRVGAKYFLPVIAIQAIAIARAFADLTWRPARIAGACAAALLSAHHVIALTYGVSQPGATDGWGPYGWTRPLWCHVDGYLGSTEISDPRVDWKDGLKRAMERVLEDSSVRDGTVELIAHHAYLNTFNCRTVVDGFPKDVRLVGLPLLTENRLTRERDALYLDIVRARALVVYEPRVGTAHDEEVRQQEFLITMPPEKNPFEVSGEPIVFENGDRLWVFRRRQEIRAAAKGVLDALAAKDAPRFASVLILSAHPYVTSAMTGVHNYAQSRGFQMGVFDKFANGPDVGQWLTEWAMRYLATQDYVIARVGPDAALTPAEREWYACLTTYMGGADPVFEVKIPPMPLGDGTELKLFTRNRAAVKAAADLVSSMPRAPQDGQNRLGVLAGDTPAIELVRQVFESTGRLSEIQLDTFPTLAEFRAASDPGGLPKLDGRRRSWSSADFLVVCQDPKRTDPLAALTRAWLAPLTSGPARAFEIDEGGSVNPAGPAPGATLKLYRPVPRIERAAAPPADWTPSDVDFVPPDSGDDRVASVKLVAHQFRASERWLRVELALTTSLRPGDTPQMVVRLKNAGVEIQSIPLEPLRRRLDVKDLDGVFICRGYADCSGLDLTKPGRYTADVEALTAGTNVEWRGRASIPLPELQEAK
jgi:hypothetical protein